jgi:competence protein ComEA
MKSFVFMLLSAALLFGAVDINTATKADLMSLKGIGEKKADAIVAYRTIHCFKDVHALTAVKGIGEKFIEKNKENLTAGECK